MNTAQFEFPCGQDTVSASIGELVGTAEHLAAALAELPAQTFVVLALPHGPALASSLLACLMANLTAVPLPVDQSGPAPQQCARIGQAAAELAGLGNCVTLADTASAAGLRAAGWSPAQRLLEVERLAAGANGADGAAATGVRGAAEDDLALVLFSSGSGAAPKAVGLSHENLWRQIGAGAAQWAIDADSTVLSWLSPSHNFGLHFGLLVPLFQGARCRILDAQAFMARPRLLFDTIAACRATHFAAPNFVLDLCADALAGERWDGTPLASLSHIVCGGEPVRRRTVERFNTAFGVLGLGAGVIRAHYGLSETGAICTRREALEPAFLALDAAALQQGVLAQAEPGAATLDCANCGALGDDIAVRIVTDHAPSPDGRLGEIWVRSASVARNYLGAAADQAQSFGCVIEASAETGFFRTGDLGFVRAGCLYVAGREKEVMIVRGKNHFPADLEASIAAATSAQLTPVVFGVEHDGAERIVALLGSAAPLPAQTLAALAAAVRQQLATRHGVALHDLAFGSSAELRGAQTGKLNRRLVRQAYLAGALALQRLDGGAAEAPGPAGPALAGMIERLRREAFTPVLGAAAQALGEATPFGEAGLDSLQSLRLAGLIAERWALPFAPTQLFRLQNLREVALHLLGQDAGAAAGAPAAAGPRQVGGDGGGGEPIALVAMHGEFPGAAPGLDGFWELLRSGGDAIGLIEQQRPALWEALLAYPGQQRSRLPRWAGLLEQVDCFDAAFFGISRREAECMDPQQRKVLELLWTLAESAGQRPSSWSGQNIGLFVGAHATDYAEVLAARPDLMAHSGAYMDSGTHLTMIANRASRWFNLNGPSEVINTACSSSLVALHRAVASLRKGESSSAIVVGINLILTPRILLASAAAGMLAADGRCKTLDARADGFVRAEGIGAVMLKPLARALADGDHIHGCIRAVGVNHDGRSNSLRAPNGQAQSRLLVSAYRDAGIDMASIGYLELHGTGTALGDPIEVQAIQQAFATLGAASAPGSCALGSVKSNIGHAEAAAGMAGLLKVMLSFRHETLPATRHIASLNPHITLDGGRLQVLHTARPWPENAGADAQPRRAGLSSFGFGGANAHAVLEAYPQPRTEARSGQGGAALVILSAKTGERLQAQARQLCDWLAAREADGVDLDAVAYTLQVGRDAMPCRLGLVAASASELQQRLRDWLRGDATLALATLAPGASAPAPAQPPALHDAAGCAAALELWLAGAALDWEGMARPCTPQRIALPTYPFLKERHWVPPAPAGGTERAQLHPLLHRNTSDLRAQRYSSRFDGSEFFLDQHRIDGVPVLPASAHLELARAAVALAHGDAGAGVGAAAPVLLEQIKFVRPLALSGGALEVHIELRAQPDGAIAFEIRSGHGADSVLHSQGRALGGATPAAALDLATLRATVRGRAPSPSECYAAFGAAGLDLGASFNCLRQLALGPDQHGRMTLLADLVLPQEAERGGFGLHPALLDGALQATLGLQRAGAGGAQALPFALHSLQFLRPLPEQLSVVVRYSPGSGPDSALQQFDIDLHAADGALCASLRQLSSRAAPSAWTLVPGWQQLAGASGPAEPGPAWPGADAAPVLIGAARHVAELTRLYPRARQLVLAPGDSVAQIGAQLRALGPLDHLLWLAPALAPELTSEALLSAQAEGVFSALRLVKALLARDDGAAPLGLTIITQQCAALGAGDPIRPAHAALHGLFGTLAKEAPRWQVRLIDLPEQQPWPAWPELLAQPADPQGAPLLYRDGLWYRPCMRHARLPVPAAPPYRQGGVYVVLGGAGGIGATWSEHLIRNYQAQVVWIGRRPQDQAISEHMRRLGQYGPAPHYISADATDGAALRAAWEEIDARYGVVNGVVLSTIVLRDQALGRMDEDDFAAALGAKLDVAVRLAQVLAGRPHPDFVLFFSSLQSASKARGQANYASACVAGDAFASAWAREGMPVKIVNWGYWGSVGIVASPDYRRRMAQLGMGSIEAQEAMAVLDRLLTLPLPQLAFLRTTGGSAGADLLLHADEAIEVLDAAHSAVPVPLEVLQQRAEGVMAPQQAARELAYAQQLEQMLARLLDGQLRALGVDDATRLALPGWQGWAGLGTLQRRWLEHSVRMLTQLQQQQQEQEQEQEQQGNQAAAVPLAGLWEEWRSFCAEAGREPSRAAQLTLLDVTLHALPDILAGRRRAVDVLFPHGALTLVEGIYKHNPVADYHNQALSDSLAAYIEQRPAHAAPLRILEIGAGTGGTSALLLERLKQYPGQLAEYCYSDVSPVFLQHAEQHYAPGAPWLRTALFDVERAPAEQGLACGSYDLVIATNVLHATRNLHRSLRHAKALLKRNGLLLLNEISTSMLATHLSFGLLDGWWRYEDAALRLAGTPALTADSWRRVLQDEGYAVLAHPAHPAGDLGHQIVLAQSDGVLCLAEASVPAPAMPDAVAAVAAVASVATATSVEAALPAAARDSDAAGARQLHLLALGHFGRIVADVLKIEPATIDPLGRLEDYGMDSIVIVELTSMLQTSFSWLDGSVLFEGQSIDALVTALIEHDAAAVWRWVGATAPATAAPPLRAQATRRFQQLLAGLLGTTAEQVDPRQPLGECGIDSIIIVELTEALQALFPSVDSSLLFDTQSIDSLVELFVRTEPEALAAWAAPQAAAPTQPPEDIPAPLPMSVPMPMPMSLPVPVPAAAPPTGKQDVAIVGLSGRYPQAATLDAMWDLLREGRSGITQVPAQRWAADDGGAGAGAACAWGGFIDGVDEFDPGFFGLSAEQARNMDPQERLFLQQAHASIEDAGYTPAALGRGGRVGVFAGVMHGYYPSGASYWSIANRTSFLFNFDGPSMALDSACSSSLTALHVALDSLAAGSCDIALVGGVNLIIDPRHLACLAEANMLSSGDKCRAFGDLADGFVDAEGCGVMVLKRLDRALADGDHVHAVVKGSMINAGGKTVGYGAPSPTAQEDVVRRAMTAAGVDPRTVSYVEAHGTGTLLGDAVEVAGLSRVFRDGGQQPGFCALGSVKSNLGHAESAAGMAAITKTVLQMRHGQFAPSLHARAPNPLINFAASPFKVVQELTPWQRPRVTIDGASSEYPRRAGVSAFGGGGANAHVVLEEYLPAATAAVQPQVSAEHPALIVLSARSDGQLREQVEQLLAWAQRRELGAEQLASLAYTLQVGRGVHCARLALLASDQTQLTGRLRAWLDQAGVAADLFYASADGASAAIAALAADDDMAAMLEQWIAKRKYAKLLDWWVKGLEIDWTRLYGADKPRRLSAPTYPFARERYWIDGAPAPQPPATPTPAPVTPAAPGARAPGRAKPHVAPSGPVEATLARLWQELLAVEAVGAHDSFFELGGNSLRAMQLVARIRTGFDVEFPVAAMLDTPQLDAMAAHIAQLQREGAGAAAPITRAERGEALPLAYQQERLWFVHEHMPEQRTSYNIVVAAHFHGTDFSAAAMAAAYQDLLARHEVLRTRFVFDAASNAARQVIAPTLQLDIAQRDIAAEALPALIGAAAADCVDLAQGPLLKVALLRLSDEHHVVLSTIHHIVSDGWSQGVIAHDLRQLYAARRGAPAAALAPLAVQYADYAAWQRRQDMSAHLAYWSGALAGYVDGIELPYDAARGAGRTWRAAVVEHHYSPQLAGALASFSQARQCTLFVTLLCALAVVLQRYSGRDDLCIGTTVAGRERAELEHLVG
ncbi:SDR family NAD(P)-dependent oxidoreductase, partial [Rugamonas sp. CCM 8940]|uniref:SDR family NAD(P)-dependent oxidoreductase n=1 Tax=Rugamonas sp. CCM 8940 TaxID=2765359 RepID=UPI0018F5A0B6